MKKILILLACLAFFGSAWAQNVKKVTVATDIKGCWIALIPVEETQGKEYGWWSIWHEYKKGKKYLLAPATFKNVKKGKYIVVAYNPASKITGNDNDADGAVMEEVDIQGAMNIKFKKEDFKTWNCLSCPWLYVWDGKNFVKRCEVLKDVVGVREETTWKTKLGLAGSCERDGFVKIRIQEEKDEVSYIDQITLKTCGATYLPVDCPQALAGKDKNYLTLKKGEFIELTFAVGNMKGNESMTLETTGYYVPDKEFLSEIYQKYLRTK
jgi:hypothetical protein